MDLVSGARRVVVAMTHTAKGAPKIKPTCDLPMTAMRRVDLIVTEMAVIQPTDEGLVLRERGPGVPLEVILAATKAKLVVNGEPPEMRLKRLAAQALQTEIGS